MTKVIAVCNQKGGVAKTTSSINLGIALVRQGKKVLLVDCDPQASLTTSLGFDPDTIETTLADGLRLVTEKPDSDKGGELFILKHQEGVDLVPANITLAGMELALVTAMSREYTLKRFLERICKVRDRYDYVLIDCLPSLGMLMQNALAASDEVIIPVVPNYLSATGMIQLLDTIKRIKMFINSDLKILGIVLTIVDKRTNITKETVQAIKEEFGNDIRVFDTLIPSGVKAAEAPISGKSLFSYDPTSKVTKAYELFSSEFLEVV
ncbi:chromosome partitioning protein [Ruminococcaceae bacterium YRB3002]|nr:chromosome partitioning protein [Ruminococcaceae bacterium YRB3002]